MPVFTPEPAATGPLATDADHAACRAAIRAGSKSFHAASLLLPPATRRPVYGLYAFCRLSDDAVDTGHNRFCRVAAAERLGARLSLAYARRPADNSADRALADLLVAHDIPEALPRALIEGLAWDAAGRRYADLSELSAYAARVAGTVGAMMALIMGVRAPGALARALDLGAAMQFTNIARDVGEDARAGRLYLPLSWLAEAGIDPEAFLADPGPSPALADVVARLLAEADRLYARAWPGIAALPAGCRPAIRAAALIYAEIGRDVEANGLDSVTRRARVGAARKAALLARAVGPSWAEGPLLRRPPFEPRVPSPVRALAAPTASVSAAWRAEPVEAPPVPEAAFLVEAVARHPACPAPRPRPAWWDVEGQAVHVLDLIETLREREVARTAS